MIDHTDLVARMRDIHYPPLGEDLYILLSAASGIICALCAAIAILYYSQRRGSSISDALRALDDAQVLPPDERVTAYAHIIRTVIASLDNNPPSLTGDQWLEKLDCTFRTDFFSTGNGRLFGNNLYLQDKHILPDQLDNDLKSLIKELGNR